MSDTTDDLFQDDDRDPPQQHAPLSARFRPRTLEEFVGQQHLLGPGKLLRRALEADRITSLILYGPPGTGKTAFAGLLAQRTRAAFDALNATMSNVEQMRHIIMRAQQRLRSTGQRTILFIDEMHRFNKAQQDVLMPHVEAANPIVIGATTHNPFFSIISPMISRSLVCEFHPLTVEDIEQLLRRALADEVRGLGARKAEVDDEAMTFLATQSEGDARRALNALELAVMTTGAQSDGRVRVGLEEASESLQKKPVVYDRDEDAHYDTISAFIKSMRGSDPDAALYWMAKMLYAGEDPMFIARRLVICAAEDVGNADPQALVVANAAMQALEFVGLPEGRIPLAQAVTYIACAPKSNAAYLGINRAMSDVESGRVFEVPKALRDASYKGAKRLGRGTEYKYAHDYPGHYVAQRYLPEDVTYYEPSDQGMEREMAQRLEARRSGKASQPADRKPESRAFPRRPKS